jgi:hypothetical protein
MIMIIHDSRLRSVFPASLIIGSITLFVGVTLSSDAPRSTPVSEPNVILPSKSESMTEVDRKILSAATQHVRPSLEMKENVDFLLTPALLVQEAASRGNVTTYPSE